MRISTRLSIIISLIASTTFIGFGITIYAYSTYYQKKSFNERISHRVEVTEKIFLEKDSFRPEELEKVADEFLHTLPKETEEMVEIIANKSPVFQYTYSKEIKDSFLKMDEFTFAENDIQGMSKVFKKNGKAYLIIVTAEDTIGIQKLSDLLKVIILIIVIAIPFIFLGSFLSVRFALLPISKKIEKANTISASNLHQRLEVQNPKDELGLLAISFNNLLDRLEESFKGQKSFISNASHELRNPLTAIIGEAEITLSMSRTVEEYQSSMSTILQEAEILNSTVNNLLQLSKISVNEINVQFTDVDFIELLKEINNSYNFINPDHNIELLIEDSNNTYLVFGNRNLLKTAILNLFDNACKFSSNAKVEVRCMVESNQIYLQIVDFGIGILESDIERILLPFYRGNNTIKLKGSGIGLSLSSKIIALHDGSLIIKSIINKQTTVKVLLPLKKDGILI